MNDKITAACPSCNAQFQVAPGLAGKQGKCPKCQSVFTIGGGGHAPPGAPPPQQFPPQAGPPQQQVPPQQQFPPQQQVPPQQPGPPQQQFPQQQQFPPQQDPSQPYPGQQYPSGAKQGGTSKMTAGLCGILIGALGVHKFVLGLNGAGLTMLLVTLLSCGFLGPVMGLIGLIEGIIYLTKSDEDFHQIYVVQKKAWF